MKELFDFEKLRQLI